MIERTVQLQNKYGLHARPATLFAERANGFTAEITVKKDEQVVNGKSIFGIMMLGAEKGATLIICADGQDEEEAVTSLEELITHKFYEE